MFSFSRFRGAENSRSESDDDKDSNNFDDHSATEENSDNEDGSRLRFDYGDVDDLKREVAELEEELMGYKVTQMNIKLAKQGLIQKGRKPELIKHVLNPQTPDLSHSWWKNL